MEKRKRNPLVFFADPILFCAEEAYIGKNTKGILSCFFAEEALWKKRKRNPLVFFAGGGLCGNKNKNDIGRPRIVLKRLLFLAEERRAPHG